MPFTDFELTEMKRAYLLLGVPFSATAHEIQYAYQRITHEWRSELAGTVSAVEAQVKERRRAVTQAYDLIEFAPLRYEPETVLKVLAQPEKPTRLIEELPQGFDDLRPISKLEYGVRFVCGLLAGLLLGLYFLRWFPLSLVVGLVCGILAAAKGDGFWQSTLGGVRWWFRWHGTHTNTDLEVPPRRED